MNSYVLIFCVLCLTELPRSLAFLPGLEIRDLWESKASISRRSPSSNSPPNVVLEKRDGGVNYNLDGTPFLWLPEDEYSGKTFFE